jgi:hypothetical protein
MSVAKATQLIKGGSSAWAQETFTPLRPFAWQSGDGAFGQCLSCCENDYRYPKSGGASSAQKLSGRICQFSKRNTVSALKNDIFGIDRAAVIRASLRYAAPWGPDPGDKSPGYSHLSLRDEEPFQTGLIFATLTSDPTSDPKDSSLEPLLTHFAKYPGEAMRSLLTKLFPGPRSRWVVVSGHQTSPNRSNPPIRPYLEILMSQEDRRAFWILRRKLLRSPTVV